MQDMFKGFDTMLYVFGTTLFLVGAAAGAVIAYWVWG